jgi:hypothetical protein
MLSQLQIKRLETFVKNNPLKNLKEIKQKLNFNCHLRTLTKYIKKLGFRNFRYRHKPKISEENKLERVAFARKYSHWSLRQWKKVLFSDESSVELGKIYPRKIWRKPGQALKPGFFLPTKLKFGKKYIKVWSTMSYNGVGKLVFIENRWNRYTYRQILSDNLMTEAHRLIGRDFIFQEDGDKVHHANVVQTWKRRNKISLFEWPAQSCDLSPIENLWSDFKKRLSLKRQTFNIQDFKAIAEEVWEETEVSKCRALIESMPRRIRAVLESQGEVTKY